MEFSIDFGNLGAPPVTTDAPRWASVEGVAMPLGPHEFVFRVRDHGAQYVLDATSLQALDLCREFRARDDHAARLTRELPALRGDATKARALLESLAQRRLLIEDAQWLAAITQGSSRELAAQGPIVIRACDRPARLRALLTTLADNERAHGQRHRYVIIDDSRDPHCATEHAKACEAFARDVGVTTQYLGPEHWRSICARLQAAVPEHRLALARALAPVHVADARFGGGRGYCRAALIGAGRRYVMLDDDFLLPLRAIAASTPALELPGTGDQPVAFHADVDSALAAGQAIDGDPFARHFAWCGQSIAQVLAGEPAWRPRRVDLAGRALNTLRHLRGDARVAATVNGHRGSSGTASSDWLLVLPPHEREALCRDANFYAAQRDGGSLWFGATRPRFAPASAFTPFMIDGGVLVPPAPIAGRGEDLIFGQLLAALDPESDVLLAPMTIGHRQEAPRARAAALERADTPGFNHFLGDWLRPQIENLRVDSANARLLAIAARVQELADSSDRACADYCAEYLNFRRADLVDHLRELQAHAPHAPSYWRADVERAIAVNRAALETPGTPALADWPQASDVASLARALRAQAGEYAELLRAWPAVWNLAREMGEAITHA